jgi:DNA-directed RNA polymerase specialized sigma subunit
LPNEQGRYDVNRGKDYMIMESINSMPAKVVHVFDLRYDEFRVGRSVETDMKIADISVSRTHSYLKVQGG